MNLRTVLICSTVFTLVGCSVPEPDDVVADHSNAAQVATVRETKGTPALSPDPQVPAPSVPGEKLGRYGDCYLYVVTHNGNYVYVTGSATGNSDDGCAVATSPGPGRMIR